MSAAIARHAGARHAVVTDMNPYRLELAKKWARPWSTFENLSDVQELGMEEGFGVKLEMSGSLQAFNACSNMCHGGKIAMLGIPEKEMAIDWNIVVFNATIKEFTVGKCTRLGTR